MDGGKGKDEKKGGKIVRGKREEGRGKRGVEKEGKDGGREKREKPVLSFCAQLQILVIEDSCKRLRLSESGTRVHKYVMKMF